MVEIRKARFRVGQVVCHRHFPFRGVIFDVDPVFDRGEPVRHPQVGELFGEFRNGCYRAREILN
jgi:heat shock protein HspQ